MSIYIYVLYKVESILQDRSSDKKVSLSPLPSQLLLPLDHLVLDFLFLFIIFFFVVYNNYPILYYEHI